MLVSFSIWWLSFPNELEAHNYQSIGECVEKQQVLRESVVHFSTKVYIYIMHIMYTTQEFKISLPITKYIVIVLTLPVSITVLLKYLLSYTCIFSKTIPMDKIRHR